MPQASLDFDQSYFAGDIRNFQNDQSHETIKMEVNKCINCGACVRACAEIKGFNVLSYVGRGFTTRMVSPFGRSLVDTICDGTVNVLQFVQLQGLCIKKESKREQRLKPVYKNVISFLCRYTWM